jgi:hypothetical protein
MGQPALPAFPFLRPALVRLVHVLLSQRPSLHRLRQRFPTFVRLLRRYYVAVRLPVTVHVGLIARRFLPPDHCRSYQWSTTGPLGSRAWSFYACVGSLTPQGCSVLALAHATLLPSGSSDTVGLSLMLVVFRAQYPAYIYLCQRFDCGLAAAPA